MDEKLLTELANVPSNVEDAYKELEVLTNEYARLYDASYKERQRLNYELDLIKKLGIAKIFLLGHRLCNNDVLSASICTEGYSYVNYLLGISLVNPILYNLPFERLFNEYRIVLPEYCFYVEKGAKGLLLKAIYEDLGKNTIMRSKDNICAYFISSHPINEDLIKEKIIVANENKEAYEENISILTRQELYALGYYCFDVIEVEKIGYSTREKFSEEEIYQKAKKLFPNYQVEDAPAFTEIEEVKNILVNTEYKLIYQDQLIEILHKICGFDMAKADYLRRETAKAKKGSLSEVQKILLEKFGDKGQKLFDYLYKQGRYTVLKAYVIASLHNMIEY